MSMHLHQHRASFRMKKLESPSGDFRLVCMRTILAGCALNSYLRHRLWCTFLAGCALNSYRRDRLWCTITLLKTSLMCASAFNFREMWATKCMSMSTWLPIFPSRWPHSPKFRIFLSFSLQRRCLSYTNGTTALILSTPMPTFIELECRFDWFVD